MPIQHYMASVQHVQASDFFLVLDRVIWVLVFCHRLEREKTARGLIGIFIFKQAQLCSLSMQACLGNLKYSR